jgi:Fe-Mn family superoxide dismutase
MKNKRRDFIKNTLISGAGLTLLPFAGNAESIFLPSGPANPVFSLPDLPYAHNALEPYIDEQTMRIHHGKHHDAYVKNLNKAIDGLPEGFPEDLKQVFSQMEKYPTTVRNNGGGHWNHSFFWETLRQGREGNGPSEKFLKVLTDHFGSFEAFQKKFKETALGQFGSGWAWLIRDGEGKLAITGTPNQDNPLMSVAAKRGKPLLGLDVWEHAYYLKYQNKRGDYIDQFWRVVNWEKVEELDKG